MVVSYKLQIVDLIQAAKAYDDVRPKTVRRLTSGLLALAGAFLLLQGSHLAWGVAFLLVSVIEWFDLFPAWAARGWLEYKWNPKFKDEYTLTVTSEHLRFKTSTIETTVKWDHYTKVLETDKIFVSGLSLARKKSGHSGSYSTSASHLVRVARESCRVRFRA